MILKLDLYKQKLRRRVSNKYVSYRKNFVKNNINSKEF